MDIKTVEKLIEKIENGRRIPLPQNSFFTPEGEIVCLERKDGVSRYPYTGAGIDLWAKSNGYISACEGNFNIFREANYNEDAVVNFFGGIADGGGYIPVSVTGADRISGETGVVRYVVYTDEHGYYIAKAGDTVFALELGTDKNGHMRFALGAYNFSEEEKRVYLASYFEPMLRYIEAEGFFNRMTKYGGYKDGKYALGSLNICFDSLLIRCRRPERITEEYHTVSRSVFLGASGRCLANADSLVNGKFGKEVYSVNTTHLPAASDIFRLVLPARSGACAEYELTLIHGKTIDEALAGDEKNSADLITGFVPATDKKVYERFDISFGGPDDKTLDPETLSRFVKCVQKQSDLCAMGKNYAGNMLGIRDVFQQLEAALLWRPDDVGKRIVEMMDFILSDGRAPRQISFPTPEKPIPDMDLRPYIDQGVWIISTVYTYLCYTGDRSLLDEKCSYYVAESTYSVTKRSDEVTTVLEHLIRICDYLVSKLDTECKTNCLRALYGDWNDALDGLGMTRFERDGEKPEFGSGVSVMATLQLYRNLDEMIKILSLAGGYENKIEEYRKTRSLIEEGLKKNAVVSNGERARICHGWGDMGSYRVGSFNDCDGKPRISLTANAFWSICGMLEKTPELKDTLLDDMKALESKYGYLTFSEPFPFGMSELGRISTITPGTYENCCSYVHAGTFGCMAQFEAGQSENAWRQLIGLMTPTHENCSMSTFVMPNSYCFNPDYNIDGESMGDWYTGSGCMLIKTIVGNGFGIRPEPDGLKIVTASTIPFENASVTVVYRGKKLSVNYKKTGENKRGFIVDGKEKAPDGFDREKNCPYIFIGENEIGNLSEITVTD